MARIELILANGPGFPQGSPEHRYVLEVTLTSTGQLDDAAWFADPAVWPAERVWPGDSRDGDVQFDAETGWWLTFRPGNDSNTTDDDLPLQTPIRGTGPFRPGEYVTIHEPNGKEYAYRVVSVG